MSDNYPVDGELRRQAERIEALEQAHAELAEEVEQMISKAGTDCDKCEGRGWRINVPSQTMYPCTWCSGKGKVNISATAPDPVCTLTDEQDSALRHALTVLREIGDDREARGLTTGSIDQSCNVIVAMISTGVPHGRT